MIGAIASASRRRKYKTYSKRKESENLNPDHTGFVPYTTEWKNKHLEWVEAGLCSCCGAPSGEELGICDECRWT